MPIPGHHHESSSTTAVDEHDVHKEICSETGRTCQWFRVRHAVASLRLAFANHSSRAPTASGAMSVCPALSSGSIEPQRLFAAPSLPARRSATWIRRDRPSLQNAALEFAHLIDCFVARDGRPAFQPVTSCGAMNCSAPNARNSTSRRLRKAMSLPPGVAVQRSAACWEGVPSSMIFLNPLMRLCHGPAQARSARTIPHILPVIKVS
jgi:hypothetical protein